MRIAFAMAVTAWVAVVFPTPPVAAQPANPPAAQPGYPPTPQAAGQPGRVPVAGRVITMDEAVAIMQSV